MKQKGNKMALQDTFSQKVKKEKGQKNKNTPHKRDDKEHWMQQLPSGVPSSGQRPNISYNSMYNMAAAVQRRSDT